MRSDTIVAIATGMTNSGIGIIRISGPEAITIANCIYESKGRKKHLVDVPTHTIHYGFIIDPLREGERVDEVMVCIMKAPNSYTTENTVEINCHGGVMMVNQILQIIIQQGARIADPGEFTKRAFLNGRIDLSEAEAVIDVIHSKSKLALKSSFQQLSGALSEEIKQLRSKIIYEIAFIESALDDPEHISLIGYQEELMIKIEKIEKRLQILSDSAENGLLLKEGIKTVIVGKPNAGKSSLLNILVGEEKAIVTSIAGTTRDILEEQIKLAGIGLNIIDTAGIHNTEDEVEKIGVLKAKKYAKDADLIIFVVDASIPLDEDDFQIIHLIQHKKVIILLNKTDLELVVNEEQLKDILNNDVSVIKTSTKENTGIELIQETIKEMFFHGNISYNDEIFITNLRHKEAISDALESVKLVKKSIIDEMPEDFYSIDLMSAYVSLGYIIGEEVTEDLVNEIFSKFCMGK